MEYRPTKRLFAILVLAGALLPAAGCTEAGRQPQASSRATAVESQVRPSEPSGEQVRHHVRPGSAEEPAKPEPSPAQDPQHSGPAMDVNEVVAANGGHGTRDSEAMPAPGGPTDSSKPPAGRSPEPDRPTDSSGQAVEPKAATTTAANETRSAAPNDVRPTPPKPDVPAAQASREPAPTAFYRDYAEILKTYVREDGLVDYSTLDRHRLELKALLMQLDELDPKTYENWPQDAKLALWINAYNLKMLEIITRNYPIESSWWLRLTWPPSDIRHIEGIWTGYKFIVMDEEFTLAEVEQRLFHKTFDDPRVFLAITCACRSSPWLRSEPYRPAGLDRRLDEQVRQFLANPQGFRIDRRERVVHLSALFKPAWRGKEFVRRYGTDKKFKDRDPATRAVLNFLTGYLSRDDVYFLEVENYRIEYMNFDWRLNDTSRGY